MLYKPSQGSLHASVTIKNKVNENEVKITEDEKSKQQQKANAQKHKTHKKQDLKTNKQWKGTRNKERVFLEDTGPSTGIYTQAVSTQPGDQEMALLWIGISLSDMGDFARPTPGMAKGWDQSSTTFHDG